MGISIKQKILANIKQNAFKLHILLYYLINGIWDRRSVKIYYELTSD